LAASLVILVFSFWPYARDRAGITCDAPHSRDAGRGEGKVSRTGGSSPLNVTQTTEEPLSEFGI
jgi:hypothetical protein